MAVTGRPGSGDEDALAPLEHDSPSDCVPLAIFSVFSFVPEIMLLNVERKMQKLTLKPGLSGSPFLRKININLGSAPALPHFPCIFFHPFHLRSGVLLL